MKFSFTFPIYCVLLGSVNAFNVANTRKTPVTSLSANKSPEDHVHNLQKVGTSFVAAATIFGSALVTDLAVAPTSAHAELELSKGAFIVQTNSQPGQSLLKAEIDSQSLVKSLFKNRKELGASASRIQLAIQDELKKPVWLELQKEIVDIEGDVLPSITIRPPSDFKETIKDVSKGRLNFLINGEIVNVAVEPTFSSEEDDLVIRVTGFKGVALVNTEQPISFQSTTGPIRSWLSQFEEFWAFWDGSYPDKYLPKGVRVTNGQVILTGAAGTVGMLYLFSYMYYIQLLAQEDADAAAKKAAMAEKAKAKKKAAAAKKAAEATAAEKEEKKQPEKEVEKKAKFQTEGWGWKPSSGQAIENSGKQKKRRRFRFWKKD